MVVLAIILRLDKAASKGGNLPGIRQNRQVRIRKSEGFQAFWGLLFPTSDFVLPILSKARRVAVVFSNHLYQFTLTQHLADKVAEEARKMELYEAYVTERVLAGSPIIGLYPLTSEENKKEFEAWKKQF